MNKQNSKITQLEVLNLVAKNQLADLPAFGAGDLITVHQKITEGKKTRIQKFQGVVLKKTGKHLNAMVLVRKETNGYAVEKFFPLHSPLIDKIEVNRYGKVRRSYISYMRQRSGKSARIKEGKKKTY